MVKVNNEADLEKALEGLYQQWGALGFWAKRFHEKFSPGRKNYIGGVAAVRALLIKGSGGFAYLKERGHLDLSIESLVLKPEWRHLFSGEDLALAGMRLNETSKVAGLSRFSVKLRAGVLR